MVLINLSEMLPTATPTESPEPAIRLPHYYTDLTVTANVYRWLVSTYGQQAVNVAGVTSLDNRYGKYDECFFY